MNRFLCETQGIVSGLRRRLKRRAGASVVIAAFA